MNAPKHRTLASKNAAFSKAQSMMLTQHIERVQPLTMYAPSGAKSFFSFTPISCA